MRVTFNVSRRWSDFENVMLFEARTTDDHGMVYVCSSDDKDKAVDGCLKKLLAGQQPPEVVERIVPDVVC